MTRKLTVSLNELDKAVDLLHEFSNGLSSKAESLRLKIAERIRLENEMTTFFFYFWNKDKELEKRQADVSVRIDNRSDESITYVISYGKDAVFVEFGTGIYFNPGTNHPLANITGFTIGSYGKGRGKNRAWGYMDTDGIIKITRGFPASRKFYQSFLKASQDLLEIAREVFND